jgi:hypothetical protein
MNPAWFFSSDVDYFEDCQQLDVAEDVAEHLAAATVRATALEIGDAEDEDRVRSALQVQMDRARRDTEPSAPSFLEVDLKEP